MKRSVGGWHQSEWPESALLQVYIPINFSFTGTSVPLISSSNLLFSLNKCEFFHAISGAVVNGLKRWKFWWFKKVDFPWLFKKLMIKIKLWCQWWNFLLCQILYLCHLGPHPLFIKYCLYVVFPRLESFLDFVNNPGPSSRTAWSPLSKGWQAQPP